MTCTQEKHKVLCKFEFPGDANEDYYGKKRSTPVEGEYNPYPSCRCILTAYALALADMHVCHMLLIHSS